MTYGITRRDIQNQFIKQFIAPIITNLDFKQVYNNIVNYKETDRENMREDMELVGVFDSLKKLDLEGTLYDSIQADLINRTKSKETRQYNVTNNNKLITPNKALLNNMKKNIYNLENKISGREVAYATHSKLIKENRDKYIKQNKKETKSKKTEQDNVANNYGLIMPNKPLLNNMARKIYNLEKK